MQKQDLDPHPRKSLRKKRKIDYVALNEGDGKRNLDQHFHVKAFLKEFELSLVSSEKEYITLDQLEIYTKNIATLVPSKVNVKDFNKTGMNVEIKFTDSGKIVENSKIEFKQLCDVLGINSVVPVMDVLTQENENWTIQQWFDYYQNFRLEKKRLKNVISLEIGSKEFDSNKNDDKHNADLRLKINRPNIVCQNDLLDKVWSYNLDDKVTKPQVQKYCLTGVKGCYTDFHVDFAGTNVYYNVLRGQKWFLLYPMNDHNISEYKKWCNSGLQNEVFLGSNLIGGKSFKIHEGELFLIPTGYIHAVYTPENSYVIGGNYLTLGNLIKHIEVHKLEVELNVPKKFRFPEFDRIIVYIVQFLLDNPELANQEVFTCLEQYLVDDWSSVKGITKKTIKELILRLKDAKE